MTFVFRYFVRFWALLCVCVMLTSFAAAQQTNRVVSPLNQTTTVGVGDTVLRAKSVESLPNVFGLPDIFGRTRPTGLTIVQYGGLQNGKVVLLRSGTSVQSDATTMSQTPIFLPTQGTTIINGVATTTTSGGVYIPPRPSNVIATAQPVVPVVVNWKTSPRVPLAGRVIVIHAASATSLTYHIE